MTVITVVYMAHSGSDSQYFFSPRILILTFHYYENQKAGRKRPSQYQIHFSLCCNKRAQLCQVYDLITKFQLETGNTSSAVGNINPLCKKDFVFYQPLITVSVQCGRAVQRYEIQLQRKQKSEKRDTHWLIKRNRCINEK